MISHRLFPRQTTPNALPLSDALNNLSRSERGAASSIHFHDVFVQFHMNGLRISVIRGISIVNLDQIFKPCRPHIGCWLGDSAQDQYLIKMGRNWLKCLCRQARGILRLFMPPRRLCFPTQGRCILSAPLRSLIHERSDSFDI